MNRLVRIFLGIGYVFALTSSVTAQESPKADAQMALQTCAISEDPAEKADACTLALEKMLLPDRMRKRVREERGVAFVEQKKYRDGLIDLAYAIGPRELSYRAQAYIETEEFAEAISDLTEVIKQRPDMSGAYNGRAWSYFKMGKAEEGLPDAELAIALHDARHSHLRAVAEHGDR